MPACRGRSRPNRGSDLPEPRALETETDLLVGKREAATPGRYGWLIARRKIILETQNVLMTKNLTFFF